MISGTSIKFSQTVCLSVSITIFDSTEKFSDVLGISAPIGLKTKGNRTIECNLFEFMLLIIGPRIIPTY